MARDDPYGALDNRLQSLSEQLERETSELVHLTTVWSEERRWLSRYTPNLTSWTRALRAAPPPDRYAKAVRAASRFRWWCRCVRLLHWTIVRLRAERAWLAIRIAACVIRRRVVEADIAKTFLIIVIALALLIVFAVLIATA